MPTPTTSTSTSLYPFPTTISIPQNPPQSSTATPSPPTAYPSFPTPSSLPLWVDASVHKYPPTKRSSRLCASAVRYLDSRSARWKHSVTFNTLPYGSRFAAEAEFIAIHEAFCITCGMVKEFDTLVAVTDC